MGLSKLKTFDAFKSVYKLSENDSKSVNIVNEKLNESAFKFGENYKVKFTYDVPTSFIKEYAELVKKNIGKNVFTNFTESEIAEQIVDYILKTNLNIANIPLTLLVGETELIEEESIDTNITPAIIDNSDELEIEEIPLDSEVNSITNDDELEIELEEEPESNVMSNNDELEIEVIDDNDIVETDADLNINNDEEQEIEIEEVPTEEEIENTNVEEVNLGETRDIEKAQEEEEILIEPVNDIDTKMSITDIAKYLRSMGISTYELTASEMVNAFYAITGKYVIGISLDGKEIKPDDNEIKTDLF